MDQTRQAIPTDAITVGEAFELLFHAKFPEWRGRMANPDCFKSAADFAQHDRDEREVNDLLHDGYRDGTIPFYLRDVTGEVLRLTRGERENSWIKHAFANGLLASNLHAGRSHPPKFLLKADVERLAKQFGAAVRSRGGSPRKWDRESATVFLKREYGDGPTLLKTGSQAKAAEKLMAHISGGDPDTEPSKSWAESVVSHFVREDHLSSN
jgi:hypothetical protein